MIRLFATVVDRVTHRRACFHGVRGDGRARLKEIGTGRWFYVRPDRLTVPCGVTKLRTVARYRREASHV